MKKQITAGITIIACVALCAAVWPRSSEDKVIPVTQEKPAVSADIAAVQEEPPHIIFSADTQSPEPAGTKELTAEKERAPSPPIPLAYAETLDCETPLRVIELSRHSAVYGCAGWSLHLSQGWCVASAPVCYDVFSSRKLP